jgi:hypothetical protein
LIRSALLILIFSLSALVVRPAAADGVSFMHEVAPILLRKCMGCHGERANLGGYRVNTFRGLLKPGVSTLPAVVPGAPAKSRLYQLITAESAQSRMPKSDEALSSGQVATIRRWIAEGARFDGADPGAPLRSLLGPRIHRPAPATYRADVPVMALALLPGGRSVAVGGYNEITVWSVESGALIRRIPNLPQRIQAICVSPDGRTLLVAGGTPGEYGEIALVDIARGVRSRVVDSWSDICLAAAFSADGRRIAAGGADNTVRVYDAMSGKLLWTSGVHSDWVTSVSFSADGRFVASAGRDMTVKVNDAATGELFATYNGHNRQIGAYAEHAPVYAVRFAAEGLTAYSAGAGRWIQQWDPLTAKAESGDAGDMEERFSKQSHAAHIPTGFAHEVFALAAAGSRLFAASADGIVKQFDLASRKEVAAYRAGSDWLYSLDFDPKSERVAAGSYDGQVHVWDVKSGNLLSAFHARPHIAGALLRAAVRK